MDPKSVQLSMVMRVSRTAFDDQRQVLSCYVTSCDIRSEAEVDPGAHKKYTYHRRWSTEMLPIGSAWPLFHFGFGRLRHQSQMNQLSGFWPLKGVTLRLIHNYVAAELWKSGMPTAEPDMVKGWDVTDHNAICSLKSTASDVLGGRWSPAQACRSIRFLETPQHDIRCQRNDLTVVRLIILKISALSSFRLA